MIIIVPYQYHFICSCICILSIRNLVTYIVLKLKRKLFRSIISRKPCYCHNMWVRGYKHSCKVKTQRLFSMNADVSSMIRNGVTQYFRNLSANHREVMSMTRILKHLWHLKLPRGRQWQDVRKESYSWRCYIQNSTT